jgi:hypothetical protein
MWLGWGSSVSARQILRFRDGGVVYAYLPLAPGEGNVHEPAGICYALLCAALGGLLLLLGLNLLNEIHQLLFCRNASSDA